MTTPCDNESTVGHLVTLYRVRWGMRMQNHAPRFRAPAVAFLVAMVLTIVGFTPAANAQTSPADGPATEPTAMETITDCVSEHGRLSVLLLIDESGSLQTTDPGNDRIIAAQAALDTLASLAEVDRGGEQTIVEIRVSGFSETYKPYGSWLNLDGPGADAAHNETGRFASRNSGLDTDFAAALSGAQSDLDEHIESLKADDTATCGVLMMFTDGEYDIETRAGAETKPYAPDLPLNSDSDTAAAILAGMAVLCDDGGVMDQFRDSSVPIVTVAMTANIDAAGQGFIRALTTGTGGGNTCGTPASDAGQYLPAANLNEVLGAFSAVASEISGGAVSAAESDLVVCAGSACKQGRKIIPVDESERLVSTLFTSEATNIKLLVRPPNDTAFVFSANTTSKAILNSATTEAVWLSDTAVRFDIEPSNAEGIGDWRVDLIDPKATKQVEATAQTTRYGDLFPQVVGEPELAGDGNLSVTAEIVNSDGEPSVEIPAGARMTALARDAETGRETPFPLSPTDEGTLEGEAFVGTDFGPTFEIDLALEVMTDLGTELPRQTTTAVFDLAATVAAQGEAAVAASPPPPLPAQINSEPVDDNSGNNTMLIGALAILVIAAIAWWFRTAKAAVFETRDAHVAEVPIVVRSNGAIERCGDMAGPMAVMPEDLVPLDMGRSQRSVKVAGLKIRIFLDRNLHPEAEGLVSSNTRLTGSLGRVRKGDTSTARIGLNLGHDWVFELDEATSLAATDIAHRGDAYGRLILFLTPNHLIAPPDDYANSLENDLPKRAQELLVDARPNSTIDTEDENMLGFLESLRSSQ
ncbi:MAG: hypothetical protein IH940_11450 [Acidobacteria bacterium]|nr:hypothetical protein [Acidobacteriota bacterium]